MDRSAMPLFWVAGLLFVMNACGGSSSPPPVVEPSPVKPTSYTLAAAALSPSSISAGSDSTSSVTVTPVNGYEGSVTLSCGAMGGSAAPTCSFSINPITVSSTAPVSSTLTVTTSTSTPGGSYAISVTGNDKNNVAPSTGAQSLKLTTAAVIQHIVIIFQENRILTICSSIRCLIALGADIVSSGKNSLGKTIPLMPINLGTTGASPQNYDLSHANSAFVKMYDGGKYGRRRPNRLRSGCRVPAHAHPNPQFMYVNPSDVQPYFALAEQYTFGDRMFQTNQGPSFPAHQFIISGTSAPTAPSPLFAAENPVLLPQSARMHRSADDFGHDDRCHWKRKSPAPQYPCFEHQTLTDLLDAKGRELALLRPERRVPSGPRLTPSSTSASNRPSTACSPAQGPIWTDNVIIPQTKVLTDIADGQLAQVSWVIPDGRQSDHALSNDGSGACLGGRRLSMRLARARIGRTPRSSSPGMIGEAGTITSRPRSAMTAISWGSGYDYGFRVPLIVVSPYAKAAYISHTTHDFGSILKFIETTFNLPSLGYADACADDLSDCFNLTQTPTTYKTIPTPLDAKHFMNRRRPPIDPDDD